MILEQNCFVSDAILLEYMYVGRDYSFQPANIGYFHNALSKLKAKWRRRSGLWGCVAETCVELTSMFMIIRDV